MVNIKEWRWIEVEEVERVERDHRKEEICVLTKVWWSPQGMKGG